MPRPSFALFFLHSTFFFFLSFFFLFFFLDRCRIATDLARSLSGLTSAYTCPYLGTRFSSGQSRGKTFNEAIVVPDSFAEVWDMLLSAEGSRNPDRCTACFDVNGPRGMKNGIGRNGDCESLRRERKGASSFLRDRSDRSSANIFSIVRAWINGSVGIGCSSLGIECGEDCSNLKVCVIVLGCLKCSFCFFTI